MQNGQPGNPDDAPARAVVPSFMLVYKFVVHMRRTCPARPFEARVISCNFWTKLGGEVVHNDLKRCILWNLFLPQSLQRLRKVDVAPAQQHWRTHECLVDESRTDSANGRSRRGVR